MNRVFLSGMVMSAPVLRMESGEIPHLTFGLSVRHRTRAGEFRSETYRVSAWYNAARWGAEKLSRGQITGIQGYLTQRKISRDGSPAFATEIVAVNSSLPIRRERVFPRRQVPRRLRRVPTEIMIPVPLRLYPPA